MVFENGLVMHYFVFGTKGIMDVENGTANVPGTGKRKICFTGGGYMGVTASLDLATWPECRRMQI